jgi:hypothetical protein
MTPLEVLSCFTTGREMEQARIGTGGLYLATYLAIFPVSVSTMTRSMLRSRTVATAADAIASAVGSGPGLKSLRSLYYLL